MSPPPGTKGPWAQMIKARSELRQSAPDVTERAQETGWVHGRAKTLIANFGDSKITSDEALHQARAELAIGILFVTSDLDKAKTLASDDTQSSAVREIATRAFTTSGKTLNSWNSPSTTAAPDNARPQEAATSSPLTRSATSVTMSADTQSSTPQLAMDPWDTAPNQHSHTISLPESGREDAVTPFVTKATSDNQKSLNVPLPSALTGFSTFSLPAMNQQLENARAQIRNLKTALDSEKQKNNELRADLEKTRSTSNNVNDSSIATLTAEEEQLAWEVEEWHSHVERLSSYQLARELASSRAAEDLAVKQVDELCEKEKSLQQRISQLEQELSQRDAAVSRDEVAAMFRAWQQELVSKFAGRVE